MSIPMLPLNRSPEPSRQGAAFLEIILGSNYTQLGMSTGLSAFATHAQQQLTGTIYELQGLESDAISSNSPGGAKDAVLDVAAQLLAILKDLLGGKSTIDDVVQNYATQCGLSSPSTQYRDYCRQTIFHAIALATALFKAKTDLSQPYFQVCRGAAEVRKIDLSMAQRPLVALLQHLGSIQTSLLARSDLEDNSPSIGNVGIVLDSKNLSFSALSSVGKISLVWVDSLDQHLEFHPDKRRLGVFRFPSFVAATYLGEKESLLYWLINCNRVERGDERPAIIDIEPSKLTIFVSEVFRTYRFLFGQNKASRRHFWKHLKPLIFKDGYYDPMLDEICGMRDTKFRLRHPKLMALVEGRGSVFVESEFGHFGSRLQAIQGYMEKHRPNRIGDLYRDRRDQEKFFTFWAVIIFGTTAVIIALIQTLLSVAQLIFSYLQWRDANPKTG